MTQYVRKFRSVIPPFSELAFRYVERSCGDAHTVVEASAMRFELDECRKPGAGMGAQNQEVGAEIGTNLELGNDMVGVPRPIEGLQDQMIILLQIRVDFPLALR